MNIIHLSEKLKNFIACLSLLLAVSFTANAQKPVSFGLKLEANVHEFWLYDLDDYESGLGITPNLGCFLRTNLSGSHYIQTDLLLFSRNTGVKTGNQNDYFRQWGVLLPVYLAKREYIGKQIWHYGLGAYASVGINAYLKNAGTAAYKKNSGGAAPMNRWDYGISSMLGVESKNGIQFNLYLQLGLNDQLQALKNVATAINKTITFGIGYCF